MIKLPNTLPIPAPDPATPTVAAPAPINLAAESISLCVALVCKNLVTWFINGLGTAKLIPTDFWLAECKFEFSQLIEPLNAVETTGLARISDRATGHVYLAQAYMIAVTS